MGSSLISPGLNAYHHWGLMESMDSMDSMETIDSSQYIKFMESVETMESVESMESTESTESAEPSTSEQNGITLNLKNRTNPSIHPFLETKISFHSNIGMQFVVDSVLFFW